MALYTSLTLLRARFGKGNVRTAFAVKGEGTNGEPDSTLVDAKIQQAMDLMHEILGASISVPFTAPYPGSVVSVCEDLALLFARKDLQGSQLMTESYAKEEAAIVARLTSWAEGKTVPIGVVLDPGKELIVNNDDGRAYSEFTGDYRDDQGRLVDQDPNDFKSLRKIL